MYEDDNITSTPKRCVLTEVTNSTNVSPTANLKLLTNVALLYPTPPPSAVHRKEKSLQILCDRIMNEHGHSSVNLTINVMITADFRNNWPGFFFHDGTAAFAILVYSKWPNGEEFLTLFPLYGHGAVEIQLDSTAARLGVEKRRMYDIINILEAMQCAVHKRKNTYLWHGGSRLNAFLKMLKKQGESLRLSAALRGRAPKPPAPKHKTLGVLAQRFLMLFLVEPPNTLINLEMAVRVLIDSSNKTKTTLSPEMLDRQHKSKVRRLYDIANVFISIGLIEKVSGNSILKKPVFKYVGPFKIKKAEKMVGTPSPITPLMVPGSEQRITPCHVFSGRSKRKLEFSSTPGCQREPQLVTTPPHTPSHKWDEILLVADMELTRINNGIIL